MPAKKIVDETEVLRWFDEDRTYKWMSQQYRDKYNIETVPSLWANFRKRKGLARRAVRDDKLIPWAVKEEHRWKHQLLMLRALARKRAGIRELDPKSEHQLKTWLETMRRNDAVVLYDPDTEDGFHYTPRRPGIDLDMIHEPVESTTVRHNADVAEESDRKARDTV